MTRTVRLLPVLVFAAMMALPAQAADQSQPFDVAQGQQQVDDLRRRVEEVERQLFQQRLAAPVSPQGQAVANLQVRLDMLEREMASQRISDVAARVTSATREGIAAAKPGPLEARIEQLEKQRAEDAKAIAALIARIEKLEKPVAKPKRVK